MLKKGQKWTGKTTVRSQERTVQIVEVDDAAGKVTVRHKDTHSVLPAAKFVGIGATFKLVKDVVG